MHLYSLTVYSFSNNNAGSDKNAAWELLINSSLKRKKALPLSEGKPFYVIKSV